MNIFRQGIFMVLLAAGSLAAVNLTGCRQHMPAKPSIPIEGAVYHVYRPDGSHKTYFDIGVGQDFTGKLPDDVDAITVTGPKGDLYIGKGDFRYNPQWRSFWTVQPGKPEIGTYTFKLVSRNFFGVSTDTQSHVETIPIPNASMLTPSEGQTVDCIVPAFSWPKPTERDELCYQLQVRGADLKHVYRTDYVKDMSAIRLPAGVLKPGKTYQWRVRAADGSSWISLNNRSHTRWVSFSSAPVLRPCEYRYEIPRKQKDGWGTSSLARQGVDENKINAMMNGILSDDLPNIHSVLLIKNGKLVLEEYFNGYSREMKHLIASVTKSITSILIGIAIDRQLIEGVDQKAYEFFPDYKGTKWVDGKYDISLENVMTMTAGIDWDEITFLHPHPKNPNTRMYQSDHPIGFVLNRKQIAQPGSVWRYNSGLTVLLGGILKKATGRDADKFAGQYLFGPLGIADSWWGKHKDGTVYAHGDLALKPRDLAKIGYLMLNDGKWENRQIVSNAWVEKSTAALIDTYKGYGYGYQWRHGKTKICEQDVEAFWGSGTGGQKLYVFPHLDLVAVFTSKIFNNLSGHARNESLLANYIIPAIIAPDYQPDVVKLDDDGLDSYVGEYKINLEKVLMPAMIKTMRVKVIREANMLFVKLPTGEPIRLYPQSQDMFWGHMKHIGRVKFRIIRDENGAVKQVSRDIGFRSVLFDKVEAGVAH